MVHVINLVETVIARLYNLKRNSWNEKISLAEFRNLPFITTLFHLETNLDINSTRTVCSYKHFYVIYCHFWELDPNHDMIIEEDDFFSYNRHSITRIVLNRVLDGYGHPLSQYPLTSIQHQSTIPHKRRLSYRDFVYFILANEDKESHSAIEYWFRVLDTDGDGKLSFFELKPYYEEQYDRTIRWRIGDPWNFNDFVCVLYFSLI